ncbi:P-loop containing nucleoside triphosphate hydrolase protein [Endogone sp. FLAS-F59071]|nr:P-loop containing nucleoside triphosphate hydrolase protein [Endogone sp. FLAS-F59071]|eukprot:RUS15875.1 P-loop containing nucleoside triphosphate hydrolase protein [Endogone sp. FLAS-F59071]
MICCINFSLLLHPIRLNLTAANRVVLMDVWWNPAVEDQAIDRVHRIGQRLEVHVTRLKIKDTVEERIIALQEKKVGCSFIAFPSVRT